MARLRPALSLGSVSLMAWLVVGSPAAWAAGPAESMAGTHRTILLPPDPALAGERSALEQATYSQRTIWVNFDGGDFPYGNCPAPYPSWGNQTQRDAVMQALADDWAPFDVVLTTTRPETGPFATAVVGVSPCAPKGTAGVAQLDCGDKNRNDVTFIFPVGGTPATQTAGTISQEVAHGFGLEHVTDAADIMFPMSQENKRFRDRCVTVLDSSDMGVLCQDQHRLNCDSGMKQNSARELVRFTGPKMADTTPPMVEITEPKDGTYLPAGASFEIVVKAVDDLIVRQVKLRVGGEEFGRDSQDPYTWTANSTPSGVYTFTADAFDLANNEGHSKAITIYVGDSKPPATAGGTDTDATSDGTAAGETDSGNGGTDSKGASTSSEDDGDKAGCSCASGAGPAGVPVGALVAGIPWLWRGRRRLA